MSDWPEVPQFGALLREHIARVSDAARPAFLAGLERSAAARYRAWAEALPDHADDLLACAAREDRIADLVSDLFPVSAEDRAAIDEALPGAVATYYEVFAPFSVEEQLYLQSEAELQGAMAWVGISSTVSDTSAREILSRCTELEEESSRAVKRILPARPEGASRTS